MRPCLPAPASARGVGRWGSRGCARPSGLRAGSPYRRPGACSSYTGCGRRIQSREWREQHRPYRGRWRAPNGRGGRVGERATRTCSLPRRLEDRDSTGLGRRRRCRPGLESWRGSGSRLGEEKLLGIEKNERERESARVWNCGPRTGGERERIALVES